MGHRNGVITKPVTTLDICEELGVSNRKVGYLCSNEHGQINQWAKYKPVPLAAWHHPNENWYKGDDGNCGLKMVQTSNLVKSWQDGSWDYVPPTGAPDSPYRMLDFDGYDSNAVPFIHSDLPYGEIKKVSAYYDRSLRLKYIIEPEKEGQLALSDLKDAIINLNEAFLYAEVLLKFSDGTYSTVKAVTSDFFLSGSQRIDIPLKNLKGTYYVLLGLYNKVVEKKIVIPYSHQWANMVQLEVTNSIDDYDILFIPLAVWNYNESNIKQQDNLVEFNRYIDYQNVYTNNNIFRTGDYKTQAISFVNNSSSVVMPDTLDIFDPRTEQTITMEKFYTDKGSVHWFKAQLFKTFPFPNIGAEYKTFRFFTPESGFVAQVFMGYGPFL